MQIIPNLSRFHKLTIELSATCKLVIERFGPKVFGPNPYPTFLDPILLLFQIIMLFIFIDRNSHFTSCPLFEVLIFCNFIASNNHIMFQITSYCIWITIATTDYEYRYYIRKRLWLGYKEELVENAQDFPNNLWLFFFFNLLNIFKIKGIYNIHFTPFWTLKFEGPINHLLPQIGPSRSLHQFSSPSLCLVLCDWIYINGYFLWFVLLVSKFLIFWLTMFFE